MLLGGVLTCICGEETPVNALDVLSVEVCLASYPSSGGFREPMKIGA